MAAPERSSRTVLVADDDALVRSVLRMALASRGHTVIEAVDAPTTISAGRTHHVDLAILDISMPGGDAASTLASLRDDRDDRPVLVLSGAAELPPELAAAGVEFARKPIELDDFLARVAVLLKSIEPPSTALPEK